MARETGDMWPQASGSASLGAEMRNGGFTGEARPFAHVHMNSGVFYGMLGSSGVIRYTNFYDPAIDSIGLFMRQGFELSMDGGNSYPLAFRQDPFFGQAVIHSDNNNKRLVILGSGVTLFGYGQSADVVSFGAPLNLSANLLAGRIDITSQENHVNITTGAAVGTPFQNKGIKIATNYTNIALEAGVVGSNLGDIFLSAWAASGQMLYRFGPHQSWHIKQSHSSTGGPANDGFWPIAHSGQVASMISIASGNMGNVNLQNAYYGGDEIFLKVKGTNTDGILLKMREISRPMFPSDPIGDPGYAIAVSGFTLTPANPHSYGIAYLGNNALSFQGSGSFGTNGHLWLGIDPTASVPGALIYSSGSITLTTDLGFAGNYGGSFIEVVSNGSYKLFVLDSLVQIQANTASMQLSAGTSMTLDGGQGVAIAAGNNALTLTTSDAEFGSISNIVLDSATDVHLSAFAGSGHMLYRFGPYQSWFIKTSFKTNGGPFNDGYWPIAHSGNVSQLINQAAFGILRDVGSGLQYQYNFGDEITLTTRPGLAPRGILLKSPVGAKLTIPEDNISIEHGYGVAVSGFSATPTNISSYGIAMLTINALDVRGSGSNQPNLWVGVDPFRQAARISTSGTLRVDAASGIIITSPTIFMASGLNRPPLGVSGVFIPPTQVNLTGDIFMQNHGFRDVGIVNDQATANAKAMGIGELVLQTGSGTINVMVGSGIAQFLTLSVMKITAVEQTVPFSNTNYLVSDKNYQCGTEAAGTSGQVTIFSPGLYKADFKVQATKTVGTTPQVCRYRGKLNGTALLGASCNSFHYDATNAAINSGALSVLFNADAGDIFTVGVLSTLDGADNCQLDTRAALLIIQRIGPKRATF